MNRNEILAWLKSNRNKRGVAHWESLGEDIGGLRSDGVGLTQLRTYAKTIGRDHKLAQSLWNSDHHEAKLIGLLIDEPKKITREQAESQVEGVSTGYLAHAFSSCDATLPKTSFAFELAQDWVASRDPLRRRCGYGLVYELSKSKRDASLRDSYYEKCISKIENNISAEEGCTRAAMGGALIGIGKRSRKLNQAAIKAAKRIGPIHFNDDNPKADPIDVLKHLTSDYLKKKLGT